MENESVQKNKNKKNLGRQNQVNKLLYVGHTNSVLSDFQSTPPLFFFWLQTEKVGSDSGKRRLLLEFFSI